MKEFDEMKLAFGETFTNFRFTLEAEAINERSAFAIWTDGILKYRIFWDNDIGCGYLQERNGQEWLNLKNTCPPENHNAFESALLRMRLVLAEHIFFARKG